MYTRDRFSSDFYSLLFLRHFFSAATLALVKIATRKAKDGRRQSIRSGGAVKRTYAGGGGRPVLSNIKKTVRNDFPGSTVQAGARDDLFRCMEIVAEERGAPRRTAATFDAYRNKQGAHYQLSPRNV